MAEDETRLRRLFQGALQEIMLHLRPQRALVLYARGREELFPWAVHGVEAEAVFSTAPISLSLLREVYASGEPLLCADAQQDPTYQDVSSLLLVGIRAVLCVPIRRGPHQVGLLYADHTVADVTFSETDLQVLTNLARDLERRVAEQPVLAKPVPKKRSETTPVRLSGPSRVLLLRSLATLVAAGIPLWRALHVLSSQPGQKAVCEPMALVVERGQPLSEAMRAVSPAFSNLQVQLVRVAEETGAMVEVLQQLALHEERSRATLMKLRASLTYPAVLFVACCLMLLVVPAALLKGPLKALNVLGADSPLLTRVVLGVSDFVASPVGLLALVGALVVSVMTFRAALSRPAGRLALARFLLGLPKIGEAVRLLTTARFAQALALQLQAGVSVLRAVPSSAFAAENPLLEQAIGAAVERLQEGAPLTLCLEATGFFPRGFLVLVTAGEESGNVPATLRWVARMYEVELEAALEMAAAAMEPLILMLMGGAAALVCLATMLPLVKLVQSL